MITLSEYVGEYADSPDWTFVRRGNAMRLLEACEQLETLAMRAGVIFLNNPATGSGVSGQLYGGFRPQDCPIGAPTSAHKEGLAVDLYDPNGDIDEWCFRNQDQLEECGIYIEDPSATDGWSHWTIRAPKSGRRVFFP